MALPNDSDIKKMDFVWNGQPFVRYAAKSNVTVNSYDYVWQGQPFVLPTSSVIEIQIPSPTVALCTAPQPALVATVIPQNISVASSSTGGVTITPSLVISAPIAGASADDPNLIASIVPGNITAATSLAGSVSLLPFVTLPIVAAVSAQALDPNIIASIVPQDVTAAAASGGSLSLSQNLQLAAVNASATAVDPDLIATITPHDVFAITASVGGLSLSPSILLSHASVSATAVDPDLSSTVSLQAATTALGTAHAPTLQLVTGQEIVLPTCFANAAAVDPDLVATVAPQAALSVAIAIPPRFAQVYISAPAVADALGGALSFKQSITVGLLNLGANQHDGVDRAEPFDPRLVPGDLVNRGEPIEFVRTPSEVARAIAIDPVAEVADYITIFLGTAPAVASAIPLDLEQAAFPAEEFRRRTVGQSGTKRAQREKEQSVIVAARLVKVNGKPPGKRIEGFVRIIGGAEPTSFVSLTEGVTVRVRKPWEDIKIKIARVA
jgi:hypothetical protein